MGGFSTYFTLPSENNSCANVFSGFLENTFEFSVRYFSSFLEHFSNILEDTIQVFWRHSSIFMGYFQVFYRPLFKLSGAIFQVFFMAPFKFYGALLCFLWDNLQVFWRTFFSVFCTYIHHFQILWTTIKFSSALLKFSVRYFSCFLEHFSVFL